MFVLGTPVMDEGLPAVMEFLHSTAAGLLLCWQVQLCGVPDRGCTGEREYVWTTNN